MNNELDLNIKKQNKTKKPVMIHENTDFQLLNQKSDGLTSFCGGVNLHWDLLAGMWSWDMLLPCLRLQSTAFLALVVHGLCQKGVLHLCITYCWAPRLQVASQPFPSLRFHGSAKWHLYPISTSRTHRHWGELEK